MCVLMGLTPYAPLAGVFFFIRPPLRTAVLALLLSTFSRPRAVGDDDDEACSGMEPIEKGGDGVAPAAKKGAPAKTLAAGGCADLLESIGVKTSDLAGVWNRNSGEKSMALLSISAGDGAAATVAEADAADDNEASGAVSGCGAVTAAPARLSCSAAI